MYGMLLVAAWWRPKPVECAILQAIVQQQCMGPLHTPNIAWTHVKQLGS